MNLYEIDKQAEELRENISALMAAAVDEETGLVDDNIVQTMLDWQLALDALDMERDAKIEAVGAWVKDLNAEAAALSAEIDNLKKRIERREKKAESLKKWLANALDGKNAEYGRCVIKFTHSKRVETVPNFIELGKDNEEVAHYLKVSNPKPVVSVDKTAIRNAIKCGINVPFAWLEETVNTKVE